MATERVTVSGVSQSREDEVSLQRESNENANRIKKSACLVAESGLPCQEEPANRAIRAISPVSVSHPFPLGPSRPSTNVEALAVKSRPAFRERRVV